MIWESTGNEYLEPTEIFNPAQRTARRMANEMQEEYLTSTTDNFDWCENTDDEKRYSGYQGNGWNFARNKNDPAYIKEQKNKKKIKLMERFKLPLLPGEKVYLDPEKEVFHSNNLLSLRNSGGYVVDIRNTEIFKITFFKYWVEYKADYLNSTNMLVFSEPEGSTTKVLLNIPISELIPAESPAITVRKYKLYNSAGNFPIRYAIDENDMQTIDHLIFKKGYKIIETIIYDEQWRQDVIEYIKSF